MLRRTRLLAHRLSRLGYPSAECVRRRAEVLQLLGPGQGLVLVGRPFGPVPHTTEHHPFRQGPPSVTLFLHETTDAVSWLPPVMGTTAAQAGVPDGHVMPLASLRQVHTHHPPPPRSADPVLSQQAERLFKHLGPEPCVTLYPSLSNAELQAVVKDAAMAAGTTLQPVKMDILARVRAIKSEVEQQRMRLAGRATGLALRAAMACTRPGVQARVLAAAIDLAVKSVHTSEGFAFPPCLAAGETARFLHHFSLTGAFKSDDMIVGDVGMTCGHYVSDATRTWPVSGIYSPQQRLVTQAVLRIRELLLATIKRSVVEDRVGPTIAQLDRLANTAAAQEVRSLGMDPPSSGRVRVIPHTVAHSIGLDVHEPLHPSERLQPGMVVAIEPGIYLTRGSGATSPALIHPTHLPGAPESMTGLCARVEDTVLITSGGVEVLTADAPLELEQVEATVGKRPADPWLDELCEWVWATIGGVWERP